jgi:hypothetical protein
MKVFCGKKRVFDKKEVFDMKKTIIQSVLAALLVAACAVPTVLPAADEQAEAVRPVPEAKKQELTALFDGMPELGAKPSGIPAFYTNNLWEYIDGGAEAFHNFDFETLVHQVFASGAAEVTVDVYDMGEPLNSFGIYSSERSPDYRFLPIGTQGYGDAFSLNFFQGPYYAKLSVYQEGTPDSTLLPRFALKLSGRMGAAGKFPDVFGIFPAPNAVPNSEKFIKKAPLGHAFLGTAFEMAYGGATGEPILLLAFPSDDPQKNADKVAKLKAHFQESGKVAALAGFGSDAFRGSNDYEGSLAVVPAGKWTAIQAGPETAGTEPLKALLDNLSRLP